MKVELEDTVKTWAKYAKFYDPIKCASIDGTDCEPHDRAVVRALGSTYRHNRFVKGRPECTIFVSRLNHETSKDTIKDLFSKYGKLKRFRMVKDIVTGMPKGYAFVEYEEEQAAEEAYMLANKMVVDGNVIFVDFECERLLRGWKPRRLGGGFAGKKESGQLRFGCRDRPFKKPIALEIKEQDEKKQREKERRKREEERRRRERSRDRHKRKSPSRENGNSSPPRKRTKRDSSSKDRSKRSPFPPADKKSPPRKPKENEKTPRSPLRGKTATKDEASKKPQSPSREATRSNSSSHKKNSKNSHDNVKQQPSRQEGDKPQSSRENKKQTSPNRENSNLKSSARENSNSKSTKESDKQKEKSTREKDKRSAEKTPPKQDRIRHTPTKQNGGPHSPPLERNIKGSPVRDRARRRSPIKSTAKHSPERESDKRRAISARDDNRTNVPREKRRSRSSGRGNVTYNSPFTRRESPLRKHFEYTSGRGSDKRRSPVHSPDTNERGRNKIQRIPPRHNSPAYRPQSPPYENASRERGRYRFSSPDRRSPARDRPRHYSPSRQEGIRHRLSTSDNRRSPVYHEAREYRSGSPVTERTRQYSAREHRVNSPRYETERRPFQENYNELYNLENREGGLHTPYYDNIQGTTHFPHVQNNVRPPSPTTVDFHKLPPSYERINEYSTFQKNMMSFPPLSELSRPTGDHRSVEHLIGSHTSRHVPPPRGIQPHRDFYLSSDPLSSKDFHSSGRTRSDPPDRQHDLLARKEADHCESRQFDEYPAAQNSANNFNSTREGRKFTTLQRDGQRFPPQKGRHW